VQLLIWFFATSAVFSETPTRIEKLMFLGEIWGTVYLFHPAGRVAEAQLQANFTSAVNKVESSNTNEELAEAINQLFAGLNDPLCVAYAQATAARRSRSGAAPRATFSAVETEVWSLDARSGPPGPTVLEQVAEAVKTGKNPRLIVDLRWHNTSAATRTSDWLGAFLKTPATLWSRKRVHKGWLELTEPSVYGESLKTAEERILQPNPQVHFPDALAVTLVTNRVSHFALIPWINAIAGQRPVSWISEQQGAFVPAPWLYSLHFGSVIVQLGIPEMSMYGKPVKLIPDQSPLGPLSVEAVQQAARGVSSSSQSEPNTLVAQQPAAAEPCAGEMGRGDRLLGLFKMWLLIRYFFPHLELAGLDWNQTVKEYVPKVEAAVTAREYYEYLRELTGGLKDSHVRVGHPSLVTGDYTLPARFRKVQGKTIVVELAESPTTLKLGDEIVAIDGQNIAEFEKLWTPRIAASLDAARFRDLYQIGDWCQSGLPMLGPDHSPVELMVKRAYGIYRFQLERTMPSSEWKPRPKGWPVTIRFGQLAYIDLAGLADYGAMEQAYNENVTAGGLILDLRGYPQFWAVALTGWLTAPQGTKSGIFQIPVVAGAKPEDLSWSIDQYDTRKWFFPPNVIYSGPVAVLIDERTQSAAEDFCIYLRNAGRAVFIGSATAGTNGNIVDVVLPCGGKMWFTGTRVLYGDGSRFQQIGIIPDVRVDPEVQDFVEGRDRVLEKAVEVLNAKLEAGPSPN